MRGGLCCAHSDILGTVLVSASCLDAFAPARDSVLRLKRPAVAVRPIPNNLRRYGCPMNGSVPLKLPLATPTSSAAFLYRYPTSSAFPPLSATSHFSRIPRPTSPLFLLAGLSQPSIFPRLVLSHALPPRVPPAAAAPLCLASPTQA